MAPKTRTRYDQKTIARRVAAAVNRDGRPAKQVYEAAGMGSDAWYRKMNGQRMFSIEDLGRIAEALDAPEGWPFVEWKA